MLDIDSTISIILLNVNGLDNQIKKVRDQHIKKSELILFTRDTFKIKNTNRLKVKWKEIIVQYK